MNDCLACDLSTGATALPGGLIWGSESWRVEHCVGPLGVGTLIVKPIRHMLLLSELTAKEAQELGPLLRAATACCQLLTGADQVYTCLWSHAGWTPGHIHFVVQPITSNLRERFSVPGPALQEAMFTSGELPDPEAVEQFCIRAREWFAGART